MKINIEIVAITIASSTLAPITHGFVTPNWIPTSPFRYPGLRLSTSIRSQSLADMEDDVERKLDNEEPLESIDNSWRAPSRSQQSSNTFSAQLETFKEEDRETFERQKTIKKILDEDDAKWRAERRKRIMGKYADAKTVEEIQKIQDEEDRQIEKGTMY
jgi:hypothetical protein